MGEVIFALGMLKFNVDMGARGKPGPAGMGGILHNFYSHTMLTLKEPMPQWKKKKGFRLSKTGPSFSLPSPTKQRYRFRPFLSQTLPLSLTLPPSQIL